MLDVEFLFGFEEVKSGFCVVIFDVDDFVVDFIGNFVVILLDGL